MAHHSSTLSQLITSSSILVILVKKSKFHHVEELSKLKFWLKHDEI